MHSGGHDLATDTPVFSLLARATWQVIGHSVADAGELWLLVEVLGPDGEPMCEGWVDATRAEKEPTTGGKQHVSARTRSGGCCSCGGPRPE